MKILAIGNSFSQDATAYLHAMAESGGMKTKIVNLYIPGCSLKTHWENVEANRAAYEYQRDGGEGGKTVSISDALKEEAWDVVTLQQASHDSGLESTYEPYLRKLSDYVARECGSARRMLHQTWAYEDGSTHPAFGTYRKSSEVMYRALCGAYAKAAEEIHAPLIPSGTVIQELRSLREFDCRRGGQSLCRDGYHMHLLYGRYAVAAVWYESVLKGNILENPFVPDAEGAAASGRLLAVIRQTVHRVCGGA